MKYVIYCVYYYSIVRFNVFGSFLLDLPAQLFMFFCLFTFLSNTSLNYNNFNFNGLKFILNKRIIEN